MISVYFFKKIAKNARYHDLLSGVLFLAAALSFPKEALCQGDEGGELINWL